MMWEEVILENPITVAVWEENEDMTDTYVHIYRNGVRIFEFLSPYEATEVIAEIQELAHEREGQGEEL